MADDVKRSIRVIDQGKGQGPVAYGRWRDAEGKSVQKTIGPVWVVPVGDVDERPSGQLLGSGDKWRLRRGRCPNTHLTPAQAWAALPQVYEQWQEDTATVERKRERLAQEGVTMAGLADAWVARGRAGDDEGEGAWKTATAKNNATYAARIVRELGADRRCDDVTAEEVVAFLSELKPMRNGKVIEGAPTTRKMKSNYALAIRGMFSLALANNWIDDDVAGAVPSFKPRKKRAGDPLRQEEYLRPEQVRDVMAELIAGDPRAQQPVGDLRKEKHRVQREQDAVIVLTMSQTGMRPGEALALKWSSVNFTGSSINIIEARTMGETDTPKSGAGRTVPMTEEVAQALAILSQRGYSDSSNDLVFVGQNKSFVDFDSFRDRFYAAQDRAGIVPRREVRQLRNTFGTVMMAAGESPRAIQVWMGHEEIETTMIYASHMPQHDDALRIGKAFAPEAIEAEAVG